MSAFKGTPGPWNAADSCVYALNAEGFNRFFCGIQPGWISSGIQNRTPDSELAANIRLIAAAPELLEALVALFNDYKRLADSGDAGFWSLEDLPEGKQALAAIAKATGEQP